MNARVDAGLSQDQSHLLAVGLIVIVAQPVPSVTTSSIWRSSSRFPSTVFPLEPTALEFTVKVRLDVPPELSSLVMRCLAKSPEKRPQSATDLLAELDGPVAF